MAGLDPATYASGKAILEVVPVRVVAENQLNLPCALPVLDVPLALFRSQDIVMTLGIDEATQPVLLREAVGDAGSMLSATCKIGGGADVKGSIRPIGHDVKPASFHARRLALGSFRRQPPQTTETAVVQEKAWVPAELSPWAEGPRVKPGHGVLLVITTTDIQSRGWMAPSGKPQ